MELREERSILKSGGDYALAEFGDGFGDLADELLIGRGKKKWAKKRAMDAVAEGHFGGAKFAEKFVREVGRFGEEIVE
jgi:hypothetical protein